MRAECYSEVQKMSPTISWPKNEPTDNIRHTTAWNSYLLNAHINSHLNLCPHYFAIYFNSGNDTLYHTTHLGYVDNNAHKEILYFNV